MTAHPHDQHDNEADAFDAVPSRSGRVRRVFKPVVQVGWNIASYFLGGKVREARDIALFNDFEGALAFSRKHEKAINAKLQEMLRYPHPVD